MIKTEELPEFYKFLDKNFDEDAIHVFIFLIIEKFPAEKIKRVFDVLLPETIEKYSFTRILRDGENFEESVSVARDDLYADYKLWKEGII